MAIMFVCVDPEKYGCSADNPCRITLRGTSDTIDAPDHCPYGFSKVKIQFREEE